MSSPEMVRPPPWSIPLIVDLVLIVVLVSRLSKEQYDLLTGMLFLSAGGVTLIVVADVSCRLMRARRATR